MTEKEMLEKILLYDEYVQREGFSASQLGRPYLQLRLSQQYPELKMQDTDKLLSSRLGTAFHKHAETALKDEVGYVLEETLIDECMDTTISGTSDIWDDFNGIIYDHKTMQHWKANWIWDKNHEKHKEAIEAFIPQMSCLRWLKERQLQTAGFTETVQTKIIVWVVDYKKPYVRKDGTSKPTSPQYFIVDIPSMDPFEFERWLEEKLALVKHGVDVQCPGCAERSWVYDYCPYKEVCPALNKSF